MQSMSVWLGNVMLCRCHSNGGVVLQLYGRVETLTLTQKYVHSKLVASPGLDQVGMRCSNQREK